MAALKCAGCELAPIATYDGLRTCDAMNRCGSGESACGYGCLGCGDCANACDFGGITINPEKHIPEVNADVCVACGSCVKACPRHLLEIQPGGSKKQNGHRGVQQPRPRSHSHESVRSFLHRVWQMRQGVPLRGNNHQRQRGDNRLGEMPHVPQMRSRVPTQGNSGKRIPASQAVHASSANHTRQG